MGWDEKIQLKLKTIIGNIIFIAILLLIITRFLMIWTGGSFPVNLVSSNSMNPTLHEGDILAWIPTEIDEIEKGDVIVFKSYVHWPDEKIVVHRVTDIKKDSFGNKVLETKGDNNKYTDQEGPHVPEPYIREDHVMGKTLSIGKTPIKIPFIGQIGIWITQGIEQLSQPSNSKGTLPLIGIFTPMIATIIIFLLLIFTIPEKNKTFKEKIKFNIFGPKTTNLKKTFILFLIAYLAFFSLIHLFAHDSTTASVGIEANSPKTSFDLGRVEKGKETFSRPLSIINPSITKVKGIAYGTDELTDYVKEETFEIKPGKSKTLPIKAVASEEAKKGGYQGKIMVYSSPFWTMFTDEQIKNIYNFNPEYVILTLDLITSLILTTITLTIITALTIIEKQYNIITTCRAWCNPKKIYIKKKQTEKILKLKTKIKEKNKKIINFFNLEILDDKIEKINKKNLTKPIAAALIAIPLIFYINDEITAMIISAILAGLIAFFISCKHRKKIVLSSIITLIFFMITLTATKTFTILSLENELLNNFTLVTGTIGVYMLFIGILMIPIPITGWFISRLIRNVNEHRKPLLMLERKCDL